VKIGFKLDTKDWERSMGRLRKEYGEELEKLVAKTTKDIGLGMKRDAPVRTAVGVGGKLKSSIGDRVQGLTGEVWAGAEYAPYVEFGTGRLVSVPQELKSFAMQFKGQGIRQVNRKAQPFMHPHFFEQQKKYFEAIERGFDKLANKHIR